MFWIAAALLAAVVLLVVGAAFRARPGAVEAPDVAVYRDQMRELDRDVARGVLGPAEAEAARAEVGRRLLAADAARAAPGRGGRARLGLALTAALVLAAAFGTYGLIGAPSYPDLPLAGRIEAVEAARAARPGQAVAEAEIPRPAPPEDADPARLRDVERLRAILVERPDDARGWRILVGEELALGDMGAAWRAQDRLVAILGDGAPASEFALLAELMILAAGGYVSPEAERALREALRRDPSDGSARYYAGLMYEQGGRPDLAWPVWRRLVAESAPDDPWLPVIFARIERVSRLAGDPTPLEDLPRPGARGPSEADVAAAADLSPAERLEMIGGMVQGLAERLAADGGPPADWARLIEAYGVLGRTDAAVAVYREAAQVFAEDPAALDRLAAAADRAGFVP